MKTSQQSSSGEVMIKCVCYFWSENISFLLLKQEHLLLFSKSLIKTSVH